MTNYKNITSIYEDRGVDLEDCTIYAVDDDWRAVEYGDMSISVSAEFVERAMARAQVEGITFAEAIDEEYEVA